MAMMRKLNRKLMNFGARIFIASRKTAKVLFSNSGTFSSSTRMVRMMAKVPSLKASRAGFGYGMFSFNKDSDSPFRRLSLKVFTSTNLVLVLVSLADDLNMVTMIVNSTAINTVSALTRRRGNFPQ